MQLIGLLIVIIKHYILEIIYKCNIFISVLIIITIKTIIKIENTALPYWIWKVFNKTSQNIFSKSGQKLG